MEGPSLSCYCLVAKNIQYSQANRASMNIEEIRDCCLAKPGVTESLPFNDTALVFKVMGKMFTLTGQEGDPPYVYLKYDPDRAIELREEYEAIQPAWHFNEVIMTLFYTLKLYFRLIYMLLPTPLTPDP
jgi:hypothetical protein